MIGIAIQDREPGRPDELTFAKFSIGHLEQSPHRIDPGLRDVAGREVQTALDTIEAQIRRRVGVPGA